MTNFMIMKTAKITRGGQISIPSSIRRRWNTSTIRAGRQPAVEVVEGCLDGWA